MSDNPLSMQKLRQVIRLYGQGKVTKSINSMLGISRNTIKSIYRFTTVRVSIMSPFWPWATKNSLPFSWYPGLMHSRANTSKSWSCSFLGYVSNSSEKVLPILHTGWPSGIATPVSDRMESRQVPFPGPGDTSRCGTLYRAYTGSETLPGTGLQVLPGNPEFCPQGWNRPPDRCLPLGW